MNYLLGFLRIVFLTLRSCQKKKLIFRQTNRRKDFFNKCRIILLIKILFNSLAVTFAPFKSLKLSEKELSLGKII